MKIISAAFLTLLLACACSDTPAQLVETYSKPSECSFSWELPPGIKLDDAVRDIDTITKSRTLSWAKWEDNIDEEAALASSILFACNTSLDTEQLKILLEEHKAACTVYNERKDNNNGNYSDRSSCQNGYKNNFFIVREMTERTFLEGTLDALIYMVSEKDSALFSIQAKSKDFDAVQERLDAVENSFRTTAPLTPEE